MKQALIDPSLSVQHIASWTNTNPAQPVIEFYANSARVAEVSDSPFEVAPPLFWADCSDDVVADQWYYDIETSQFNPVVNAPMPEQPQPEVSGAQTL